MTTGNREDYLIKSRGLSDQHPQADRGGGRGEDHRARHLHERLPCERQRDDQGPGEGRSCELREVQGRLTHRGGTHIRQAAAQEAPRPGEVPHGLSQHRPQDRARGGLQDGARDLRPVDSDCQSCKKPCKAVSEGITRITPLNKLAQSESGRISHITSDDTEVVKRLISMGFVPGREISIETILSDGGPRIVRMGNATMALDYHLASHIFVDTAAESE